MSVHVPIICKSKEITLFCPATKRKHTGMFFILYIWPRNTNSAVLAHFPSQWKFFQDLVLDALWQEGGTACQHPAGAAPLQVPAFNSTKARQIGEEKVCLSKR